MRKRTLATILMGVSVLSAPASADISVRFDRPMETLGLGETFSIDILADMPNPIVGWGLDVSFDESVLSIASPPVIGSSFFSAFAFDGDDLAGLAFPNSISGTDVVLATLTFTAIDLGTTDLMLGITAGDLTEGFALDPTGFATVSFESTQVSVVPVPGAAALAALGLGVVGWMKRRNHG